MVMGVPSSAELVGVRQRCAKGIECYDRRLDLFFPVLQFWSA